MKLTNAVHESMTTEGEEKQTVQLIRLFQEQKKDFQTEPYPSLSCRMENLRALKQLLQEHASELADAITQDFSYRALEETLLLEVFPAINAINYCLKQVRKWIKPRKRQVAWYLKTSKASVTAQPLGVVGIMVPWNYPLYLAIVPLAYALAAGNRVMIKLSELTPHTGKLLASLIEKTPELKALVILVNGGVDIAKTFATLPFGHLLFTGSTAVGKEIMATASKNLTPVTLELGGKSPAILSTTMKPHFLKRLFMGKLFNAGQTCIAPDFLLIPKSFETSMQASFSDFMAAHYPHFSDNANYSNLISQQHVERLDALLADAEAKGARIVRYGDRVGRRFPVYLLFNVDASMRVMQEELFGPLLPIVGYETFDEAISLIKSMPNPLALYYFGEDKQERELLQRHILSGALTVNDTIMHIAVDDLPFGGIGQSGLGQYHAQEGFEMFSQMKPVFIQGRFSPITWFYPPYGTLLRLFLRYFAGIKLKERK